MKNSDALFQEFKLATEQICADLSLEYRNVKFTRYETKKTGIDYSAFMSNDPPQFSFYISTTTKDKDPTLGSMKAELEIIYSESANPFFFCENIDYMRGHPNFLQRWVAWAVTQYNVEHNPANLGSMFNDAYIQICGVPRDIRTRTLFKLLMSGILNSDVTKIYVYIFRHAEEIHHYRSYSYAISPIRNDMGGEWFFFLNFGSPDSGGASMMLDLAKRWIFKMGNLSKIEYFDISYDELELFLRNKSINEHIFPNSLEIKPRTLFIDTDNFRKNFDKIYRKFVDKFEIYEYPERMRSLRALVQTALEETHNHYKIELEENNRTVSKLATSLVKNKIIDPPLLKWFDVFSDVSNKSAHGDYPSENDLVDELIENQCVISVDIGIWLISMLGTTMRTDHGEI